ncbi:MAG: bifunctional diaminohydroxyphosphoribosylaminopyrimidine deaminase/5-amino-6-(5-phosphoribosylamino)uracil reductase RibD [Bacteroidetes bacterium]|nr:bifunctional diaminohydroxyphosphoribosylaminopyrimidine deaminase/5-amino-6-(5-phosphoribosylamino)uracil reductase RibD [Bacteroidota bacterium]
MPLQEKYIKRCLELAQLGKGHVSPNPMVGAVLVHQDRIIGEGWHKLYGEAHAEVNCIESVSEEDKHLIPDSTMYVSLEPCAHHGKTPPCANRIVTEGIKKVVACNDDPFAEVDGKGMQILKANSVEAITKILDAEGKWVNRRFFCFHQNKRPYIILKWAQSADGIFAPYGNRRYQLTNKASSILVHKWRTEEAAIMVGTNTALADNPQLTSRHWKGKNPLRIVIDRSLILPTNLNLFDGSVNTWVINDQKEEQGNNLRYVKLEFGDSLLDSLMKKLHESNIQSIIIEGGTKLLNSFIEKGLWDEARVFTAEEKLIHGLPAPSLTKASKAFETDIETDLLQVYINNNSRYPYVQGMEL